VVPEAMGVLAMTVENWEKVTIAQPEPLEKGAKMEEAPGAPLCWLRWAVEGIDTGQMAVLSSAFRIFMVCSVFFCWSEAGMRVGRKLSVTHCRAWSTLTAASCDCRTVSREKRWFERKVGREGASLAARDIVSIAPPSASARLCRCAMCAATCGCGFVTVLRL
jgi:hypothetical protein